MITLTVSSSAQSELVDINRQVQELVGRQGLQNGVCVLFVPHTTAGLTLNENWDPDVKRDILLTMGEIAPPDRRHRHSEGNSPAHIKASLVGASEMILVQGGRLQLGSWQGIYLAEFDGPRRRKVFVQFLQDTPTPEA
jgi:secondary thiamine-phosphate synthase enzyme